MDQIWSKDWLRSEDIAVERRRIIGEQLMNWELNDQQGSVEQSTWLDDSTFNLSRIRSWFEAISTKCCTVKIESLERWKLECSLSLYFISSRYVILYKQCIAAYLCRLTSVDKGDCATSLAKINGMVNGTLHLKNLSLAKYLQQDFDDSRFRESCYLRQLKLAEIFCIVSFCWVNNVKTALKLEKLGKIMRSFC